MRKRSVSRQKHILYDSNVIIGYCDFTNTALRAHITWARYENN